jgi:hypothetical protein
MGLAVLVRENARNRSTGVRNFRFGLDLGFAFLGLGFGSGSDTYDGGVGNDTAIIDSQDRVPQRGWLSVGIEFTRR